MGYPAMLAGLWSCSPLGSGMGGAQQPGTPLRWPQARLGRAVGTQDGGNAMGAGNGFPWRAAQRAGFLGHANRTEGGRSILLRSEVWQKLSARLVPGPVRRLWRESGAGSSGHLTSPRPTTRVGIARDDRSSRRVGMASGTAGRNALRTGMLGCPIPRRAGRSACASLVLVPIEDRIEPPSACPSAPDPYTSPSAARSRRSFSDRTPSPAVRSS